MKNHVISYIKYEIFKLCANRSVHYLIAGFVILPVLFEFIYKVFRLFDGSIDHMWIDPTYAIRLVLFVIIGISTLEVKGGIRSTLLLNGNRMLVSLVKICITTIVGLIISSVLAILIELINGVNIFHHGHDMLIFLARAFLTYIPICALAVIFNSRIWLVLFYFVFINIISLLMITKLHISSGLVPITSLECFSVQALNHNSFGDFCKLGATSLFFYNFGIGIVLYLTSLLIFLKRDVA